ncbi:hypothetical protein [Klenkia taihuensis]|uniref:DUF4267 domain-containing protein n=1 Tax=Klenkia taihuensis TaxID=1225127 RepID=A0A1I1QUX7_9ACTN|nr:hypothetical protein [Klenkia taihuensis]GHE07791.1 hypothetical protein GCM10011381_05700 [Klenkia taihuensis]SFD21850.1 hypothetical protein SAMN05661030_2800 [Klenkia taihuensis]
MPALTTLTGAATAAYSAALVARPELLQRPSGLSRNQDNRTMTRLVGVRDTAIGLAMVLAPAGAARRAAVGARVASDWGDAAVLGVALRGRGTRAKVVGFAALWGAVCLAALRYDER